MKRALIGLIIFILLGGVAWFLLKSNHAPVAPSQQASSTAGADIPAQLTRDTTRVLPDSITIKQRIALENSMNELIQKETAQGKITRVGIYFRDLNNGPAININEDTQFSPASLLKLPLALAYYKESEKQSGFLDNQIAYSGPNGTSIEFYPGKKGLVPGTTYTLRDLITLMLEESDNDAAAVLSQYLDRDTLDAAYSDIGVVKVQNYNTYTTEVRTYSSFFRVLYNVSYLNKADSEEVLHLLAHTSFTQGLVAGVPKGTVIAHKFGERVVDGQSYKYQLHDCGIVYVPEKNYILCVMTQGNSYPDLVSFITQVSEETYQTVANGQS